MIRKFFYSLQDGNIILTIILCPLMIIGILIYPFIIIKRALLGETDE